MTLPSQSPALTPHDGLLEIHLLGMVDFDAALFLQERLVYEISGRSDLQAGLLLCEHPSMISLGREGSRDHLLADPRELKARQMETRWLNRGGGCVVHGPGQLAAYPILPLDRLGVGLLDYRTRLEQSAIDSAEEVQVPAWRETDQPGLWCRCGEFAHLGVAVKSWVTYHGLFLDVNPKVDPAPLIKHPAGGRWGSLSAQSGKPISMNTVRENLIRHLARHLGYQRTHLHTGHPLLRRQTRRVYVDA